jgi:hypothetical protein
MSDVPVEYAPPPPPPPPPPPARPVQFEFGRPFAFIFDDPNWLTKILIGGLFYLAGFLLIGMFFVLGYAARVAQNVVRGSDTPLPEWNDLGGFFNDGARLIGVSIVYTLPILVLVGMFIVPVIIAGAAQGHGNEEVFGLITSGMAGCVSCLIVPLVLLVILFMPAGLMFAAIEERFSAAFEFGRIWAFIRENVGNYLLAIVIYLIAGVIGEAGAILFCIGVIFTGFWSVLISFHAFAQVYKYAPRRA